MRDALRDAYALAAEAQKVVGELDHAEQQSAHELLGHYNDGYNQAIERELVMERVVVGMKKDGSPEYGDFLPRDEYLRRLERAKASVSDLQAQAYSATAQANEKHRAWCGAMVRHLLNPEQPTASLAPVADSATMAPVVKETPDERRARWLAKFEAEEKREKRGALQRLADSEGVDRSNMSKDIAKARAERDTQRRAGGWAATGARRQTQTLIYPGHTRTDTRFTYENEPGNLPGLTGLRTPKIQLSHFNRHQAERQVTHANHRPSTVPTAGICYPRNRAFAGCLPAHG